MTEAEYLKTSFEYDAEFLDGEVVERVMPDLDHASTQARLGYCLLQDRDGTFWAGSGLRVKVGPGRYRVIDVAVYFGAAPAEAFPSSPPDVAIEILSAGDSNPVIQEKLDDYRQWGVPNIWLVDPAGKQLCIVEKTGWRFVDSFDLPEHEVRILKSDVFES